MKSLLAGAALAALSLASAADATTLLNVTNLDGTYSYDLAFVASGPTTTLNVAGYNLPSFIDISDSVVSAGGGGNLLGSSWNFTPAPAGSDAYTFDDGTSVPGLAFGSVVVGSYDTFSQTFATVAGTTYDYTFNYYNTYDPSGLVVSTGTAVPEPATWAVMLLGMGLAGAAVRGRRKAIEA